MSASASPARNHLTTAPLAGLIRQIAVPTSVGLFFNTMYNVVDTYFAGTISTQVLAALSLSFVPFFLIVALGGGLGSGATALIGGALGSGDRALARDYSRQVIGFALWEALLVTVGGWLAAPWIFRALGAQGAYLADALAYMNIIFAGSGLMIMIQAMNSMLNALGRTKPYRNLLTAGFFLNLLLDPWFIKGGFGLPAMGVAGIALATVLVHVLGLAYLVFKARGTGLLEGFGLADLKPHPVHFKEIARQGLPASLNYLTIGLGVFVINYFVSQYGQEPIAAYGVAIRVEQLVLLPAIGLSVAVLSLVAQNSGADRWDRVRGTLNRALMYGAALMFPGGVVVYALAPWFMGLFTDDAAVISTGAVYLRIDSMTLYAYVLLSVANATLQGMRRPMFPVYIGLWRQIVAPAVVFHVLCRVLDWGVLGVWWGVFGVTWSAALFATWYSRRQVASRADLAPGTGHDVG